MIIGCSSSHHVSVAVLNSCMLSCFSVYSAVMSVLSSLCQLLLFRCMRCKKVHLSPSSGRIPLSPAAEESPPVCMEISLLDVCFRPEGEQIRRMICEDAKIKAPSTTVAVSLCLLLVFWIAEYILPLCIKQHEQNTY